MKFNPEKGKATKMTSAKDEVPANNDAPAKTPEPLDTPLMHQSEKLDPGAMLDALHFYRSSTNNTEDEEPKGHKEESEKP